MLDAKKNKLVDITTAEQNLKSGNVTTKDIKTVLEVLEQARHNLAREIYEIELGLEDDLDYRETHRNHK